MAGIRLENTSDAGEVYHFADVEALVDFMLDMLMLPSSTAKVWYTTNPLRLSDT